MLTVLSTQSADVPTMKQLMLNIIHKKARSMYKSQSAVAVGYTITLKINDIGLHNGDEYITEEKTIQFYLFTYIHK